MFNDKPGRFARVAASAALFLAIAACDAEPAPRKSVTHVTATPAPPAGDGFDLTGLTTRLGICGKPALAQRLGVPSTRALRLVLPGETQANGSGTTFTTTFDGSAEVVIGDRLVNVDDVTQLTPCAADDRIQCVESEAFVQFADGTTGTVRTNQPLEIHAPWRFGPFAMTWVTLSGRAAAVDEQVARCKG